MGSSKKTKKEKKGNLVTWEDYFKKINPTAPCEGFPEEVADCDYLFSPSFVEPLINHTIEKETSEDDFHKIAESMASLLEYKNEKYGDAVLNPMNVFSGKCKAGTRLDDKLGRIKNSKELKKNDVADCIGYLILTCKEFGWNNFDEFKD